MAFSFTELVEDETNMEWLVESWPRVKVLLSDVGFSSTLDVARRSITMTPTTATTTADHTASIANTRFFVRLLAKTPCLRGEDCLHQEISGYAVDKDKFEKRREQLIASASKNAIYKLTLCVL
ncbi:hypothetical protein ACFX1S_026947 [Malus domestica]